MRSEPFYEAGETAFPCGKPWAGFSFCGADVAAMTLANSASRDIRAFVPVRTPESSVLES